MLFLRGAVQGLLLRGQNQEHEAERKEYGQRGNGDVDGSACAGNDADQQRAEERSALREDIVDAEVFAGVFGRDDLGVVGAGQRLNRALEAADKEGEDRKVDQRVEEQRIDRNAEIAGDADEDQRNGLILFGELGKHERADPCNNLRGEQQHDEADIVQALGRADVDALINDRADTVNVEEERDQEQQNLAVGQSNLFDRAAELLEHHADGRLLLFDIVELLIVLEQREGDHAPPDGGDRKADRHGRLLRNDLQHIRAEHIGNQREDERDAGTDIAPGIAVGADLVHAFLGGDVVQHRIVERIGCGIEDLGQHEDDKEGDPLPCEAVKNTADDACGNRRGEEDFLHILTVGQSAADRPDHGDRNRHERGRVGPERGRHALRDLPRAFSDSKELKPNRNQRAG